jgi:hypothetical protein
MSEQPDCSNYGCFRGKKAYLKPQAALPFMWPRPVRLWLVSLPPAWGYALGFMLVAAPLPLQLNRAIQVDAITTHVLRQLDPTRRGNEGVCV